MNMPVVIRTLSVLCVTGMSLARGQAIDPQLTNTTSFDIPFVVETSDGSQVAGSALLFTSVNGGPLEQTQRVPAAAGEFHFTAPADGLYGFAVRMTDAAGQVIGDAPISAPELEVVVDTSAPELTIQLQETGPGQINVTWISSDSQVAAGSVRLEYAEGIDGRWKPIDTTPTATGSATIETQQATSVSVRGFITDLAGNQGTGTSQIVLTRRQPSTSAAETGLSIPGGTESSNNSAGFTIPSDSTPRGDLQNQAGSTGSGSMGPTPFSVPQPINPTPMSGYAADRYSSNSIAPHGDQVGGNYGNGQAFEQSRNLSPGNQPDYQSPGLSSQAQYPSSEALGQPTPYSSSSGSFNSNASQYDNPSQSYPSASYSPPLYGPSSNGQAPYQPAPYGSNGQSYISNPYAANSGLANPVSTNSGYQPAVGTPQVVNNRVFDIAYEVQDVGPSGVGSVELFVTENNGQQWFKYGTDADLQSPFSVDSRGEGTFGFAVRVRNGLGFADAPPQPGERPSIVVMVDQTPPIANLAQPQIITESKGRVRLQWQVSDSHPNSAPVRLEYATSVSGPWTPVFDWQQDQGGYEMPIQPGMPQTLHFRLLARDAAGNIATAQTPHPVLIDQRRPTARLLRVQPVSAVRQY